MEDVLDLYKQPYDPKHPQVCMDETSKQLVSEVAQPIPVEPGHPERFDYEYERQGVANLFILFEPLRGWREVKVTEHRTRRDWALLMKELVDVHYPLAETIRLVMDNLNTHTAGALYETFEPAEAKRILDKLEFHYTPKHGSWLNMAEIEFSVLSRQYLDQRIGDKETLIREIGAWQKERNEKWVKMEWRFTTADARIKLKRLYPSISQ
jgi:transposase